MHRFKYACPPNHPQKILIASVLGIGKLNSQSYRIKKVPFIYLLNLQEPWASKYQYLVKPREIVDGENKKSFKTHTKKAVNRFENSNTKKRIKYLSLLMVLMIIFDGVNTVNLSVAKKLYISQ